MAVRATDVKLRLGWFSPRGVEFDPLAYIGTTEKGRAES